ncbi:YHS domain-containing (seleno)protein [Algoriphagus aquimarinus]|nr:YHS domain-containing (seleno)protein [Algoriphagus aquimarinus]
MNNYCKKASFSFVLMLLIFKAYAQKAEVFSQNDKAIKGYDPVAYFTDSKPVVGEKEFKLSHDGANWYFSSQKNLDLFKSNPSKYMPQYGGYCAFGLAGGYKAPISPDAWTIVDDKLYLNYNKKVQVDWNADQAEMIKKADKNWPNVKKEK